MKWTLLIALACALAVGPVRAEPDAAAALEALRGQDLRVASVAYRIVTANAELCRDTGPVAGWVLHDLAQYGPRLREDARRHFGLDEAAPGVLAVVPDGPAARAGLRPDDVLLAVNGEPLAAARPAKGAGDYAALEAALARIDAALRAGPAELTVRRGGQELAVALDPVTGCAYEAQLTPSETLAASADGRRVFVTTGMVAYARTEDELALVLGHEFAHDVLRHKARLDEAGFARKLLGNLGSKPADLRRAEREADYVGLYLAARAGYDVAVAPGFWRRFTADRGPGLGLTHPGARKRAADLKAAVREIEEKRKSARPLTPTPRAD